MKKIGISTIYTGYNYGSALQAYATKTFLKKNGYEPTVFRLSGSIVKNRDIRLRKLIGILFRSLIHYTDGKKNINNYVSNYKKKLSDKSKKLFAEFYECDICAKEISYSALKKAAKEEYFAFLCGSDQIWNATTMYVDPFYYLRFAPEKKRIAFAPSIGKDFIPDYNKRILKKYIDGIHFLSVREEEGQKLIKELTGRESEVIVDPTLLIEKSVWIDSLSINTKETEYVLFYFLDEPSTSALRLKTELQEKYGYHVKSIPYQTEDDTAVDAGPREFLQLLLNAKVILTDSFHGTAFSINFNKEFYVFTRNYGTASNQSSRLISLLTKVGLNNRLDVDYEQPEIDFTFINDVLNKERLKARNYLKSAIEEKA